MIYGFGDGPWSFAGRCDNRDTLTFYYAAKGALAGIDPYNNPALQQAYGAFAWWVYPPSALPFFMPLAALSFAQAVIAFNVAKAIALLGLAVVWCKTLPGLRRDLAFGLFALAALNTTLLQDWCSGNIAIFESLAIWSAMLLVLRQRYGWAVALVLLISLVKPLWLVLLLLPLAMAPPQRPARNAVLVGAAIGAAVGVALSVLWLALDYPAVVNWLRNLRTTLPIRYNVFELVKDIRVALGGTADAPPWQRPELAFYALWCAAVAWLLWRCWRTGNGLVAMLLLILAIAAVSPANLSYSWVMVVPIVYRVMLDTTGPWRWAIGVTALLPAPLLGLVLPWRDIGMVAMVSVVLALVVLALQRPQRIIGADHDQVER